MAPVPWALVPLSPRDTLTPMRILVATTNPNKVREIQQLLEGAPVELITLAGWPDLAVPEETGRTFEENARGKALYYARATGELTVAEDSGLEIDALGGAPGVESARFGGADASYPQKFALIYRQLRVAGASDPTARFVCAVAVARGDRVVFETRATVEGRIAPEPRGTGGFGYDPIFFYPPFECTFGEAEARKAAVSHRAAAFGSLANWLTRHGREG
jgi:XTP/dITP diphosphohydrolase